MILPSAIKLAIVILVIILCFCIKLKFLYKRVRIMYTNTISYRQENIYLQNAIILIGTIWYLRQRNGSTLWLPDVQTLQIPLYHVQKIRFFHRSRTNFYRIPLKIP